MKELQEQYQARLAAWLNSKGGLEAAMRIGRAAAADRIGISRVARWHEKATEADRVATGNGPSVATMRKAGQFFIEAIKPIELTQQAALKESKRVEEMKRTLARHGEQMAAANAQLKSEIARRSTVERKLQESEATYDQLLERSGRVQEELRMLSRRIISAHESERRQISRDLHDQVASVLAGINLELNELKNKAAGNNAILKRKIAKAQRLLQRSVEEVHQFARELRPPALDDLGLGPALVSLVKAVSNRSDLTLRIHVTGTIGALDNDKKTALYRVAQEALNNVLKHAQARNAKVDLRRRGQAVELTISDDGKSFAPEAKRREGRLGVLGMRERIEMVGGVFRIESERGVGTTIFAQVPAPRTT